jgi:hypothetical protein
LERRGADQIDLVLKSHPVHRRQRVVAGVGRAANGILDENDAQAERD